MSIAKVLSSSAATYNVPMVGVVVDKSGSMIPYMDDVIKGVTQLIKSQAQCKKEGFFNLAEFSDGYRTVLDSKFSEIKSSFRYNYYPNGGTCLYDAIAQMPENIENKIASAATKAAAKAKVVIAIMTDGEDTGCRRSAREIKELIERKAKEGWQYLLLGALSSTPAIAEEIGISKDRAAIFGEGNVEKAINLIDSKIQSAIKGKKLHITAEERTILALPAGKDKTEL